MEIKNSIKPEIKTCYVSGFSGASYKVTKLARSPLINYFTLHVRTISNIGAMTIMRGIHYAKSTIGYFTDT